ncbi:hypothetical protein O181_088020 [Austropuccinia psidii MF-1]|uniref:Integrase catalytic domain-containing protein n=1 Tax=Austropuccinia psidii MF-1 TaxID=1389203 RepID=A0A9Q3IR05_9BASI|nr:hypothetical protein [Austropuccinia psidii MF-1]
MYIDYTLPTTHLTTSQDSLWHNRLGHPGKTVLERLGLPTYKSKCTVCALNQAHKQPFSKSFEEARNPLDCIHLDVVGPIHPISISGFQYFLTIVDQATSFKIVKFLKKKSNAFEEFCSSKNFMENQQNKKVKKVVSDRGGEFLNKDFNQLAKDCGFLHFFSPPKTPQHNGFAERANRTILDKTRCLLGSSHLPNNYWAEAVNTAVLLSNLSPNQSTDISSPHQRWTGSAPTIHRLKTFGCQAFITLPRHHCSWKLGPSAIEGILLGYENGNTSYRILRLNDLKVAVTKHTTFNEEWFPAVQRHEEEELIIPMQETSAAVEEEFSEETKEDSMQSTLVDETQVTESQELPSDTVDEVYDRRFSLTENSNHPTVTCIRVIGPCHPTMIRSEIDHINILPYPRRENTHLTMVNRTPCTYQEALKAPDKDLWVAAINKELNAMKQLKVWDLVLRQKSYKMIGTTWVFKIKNNPSNGTSEFKARLCAQGFSQTQGIDYGKTYAPTGRLNSLRALIAFAAVHSLQFHQIDVKSAFLNAPLTEEVFLNIPQGLDANKQTHCLKLNKAIYGVKQAPLAWYKCLNDWLISVKFEPCILDPCVFHRLLDPPIWLYLHVDSIGIFSKNVMLFKKEIATRFEIKDLGEADLMLGVRIEHGNNAITLDQQHFTESLLNQYGMTNCKPASTPLVPNDHLSPATDEEKAKFEVLGVNFCSAVGSINYLRSATRPDLSFAVSTLSQYLENPGICHWQAFQHVLRYLKGTQDVGITYHKGEISGIVSWSNADWGNCRATCQSVSGFLTTFNGCLILWKTRKQSSVSTSTSEAEYKALCDLTSELLWLKQWCVEARLFACELPITVWDDNQNCINTANSDCNFNNKQMKHVDIQLHFIKEVVKSSVISLKYTPSSEMMAEFLTKSVNHIVLTRALNTLGILRIGVRGDVEFPDPKRTRYRASSNDSTLGLQ